ncbi:MAG TPA: 2-oxo-4-hydroxy-4-carboxy-5-ureidoimidazoline decarboxylase [Bacteroidota bacterium]|nr:2-oxo-4-hydroxy-4-carboxy-5-ureidoimidazoline decarboxylase [Bacteroidota bacterium]
MTLAELNSLPPDVAFGEFQKCCGTRRWVEKMIRRRPFHSIGDLIAAAEELWWNLSEKEWKEAFAHHPRIGDIETLRKKSATSDWSEKEQAGVGSASEELLKRLSEGNRLYEEKFGHIFIVYAQGKSAQEMVTILESRLNNEPAKEITIAAGELAKIMKLRFKKLLGIEQ